MLNAVEKFGGTRTGRLLQLNSMENRVYEVELDMGTEALKNPADRFRIAKFYRPGRCTQEQILEEHEFLFDLIGHEISAIAPLRTDG